MSDDNGKYGASAFVDEVEERELENQRLLDPRATPKNLKGFAFGIGCPMPTRTCTRETALALRALTFPMFGNPAYYSPDSLEVGEARNEIVRRALEDGVTWLFFLDYDVAPPPNALVKLLALKTPISAGVYHLKQVPSYPLIHVKGHPYAFEDYEVGDLIRVDGVGMGCTLVNTDVFKKIKPPWFKTVPGYSESDPNTILPHMTEDIYFCNKARDAGYDIIVDTSVQCAHVDWISGVQYHLVSNSFNTKRPVPGWTYRVGEDYVSSSMPDVNHPGARWADTEPLKHRGNPRLDLGCGDHPIPGWMGVDLYVESPGVVNEDIRNLSWYRKEYGLAPEIHSSHTLEHVSYRELMKTVREWTVTLKPGGKLTVRVPDGECYARRIVEYIDEEKDSSDEFALLQRGVYGDHSGEGQIHLSLITKRLLEQVARGSGLCKVKVVRDKLGVPRKGVWPDMDDLVLTAYRRNEKGKRPKEER